MGETPHDKSVLCVFFNNRGHAKYLQVEFDEAIEDYNRAIDSNPNMSVAYYNRGTVFYRLGDFMEALQDMQKAVSLDPTNPEFQRGLECCQKLAYKNS